jgi:DNA-binding MarR family transcriptional regulator
MAAYGQMTETEVISFLVEEVFELSGALGRVGRVIARSEGQTHPRWQVLSAASGGDRTVSQLARRLGQTRQSVQRLTDLLVSEGLVAYRSNPNHKRSPFVELTREGKRVFGRLTRRSRHFRELVAKKTTKRGLASLRESVGKLAEVVLEVEHRKDLVRR